MRLGVSLLWITSLYVLLASVDRIIVLKWLGPKDLGYYAIALLAVSLMAFIPGAAGTVFSPRIMRAYGNGSRTSDIGNFIKKPILLLSTTLPIMAGLGAAAMPYVVFRLLPSFLPAVFPAQILLLSYTPYAARSFSGEILIASKLIVRIATLQLIGLALAVIVDIVAVDMGMGLAGIASGTGLVYWFFGVSMVIMALRAIDAGYRDIAVFIIKIIVPPVWMIAVMLFGYFVLTLTGYKDVSMIGGVLMVGIVSLASTPLIISTWRQISSSNLIIAKTPSK